jgi:hypothetical protein
MGYRRPNPRRVKLHRNYSVEDIARLFNLHKNTFAAGSSTDWVRSTTVGHCWF